ncbi:MAG: YitT family protein [Firmicutes bacterium]|nr:YitT family protein [Bacillota bacterium]
MNKLDMKKEAKTLLLVVVGTAIYALGIVFFIDPSKLYTGGITGLSQLFINIIEQVTSNNVILNLGILSFVLQIPLLIFGYFKLSKRFIVYTIISVIIASVIFLFRVPESILGNDILTCAIIGGMLGGLGNGILHNVGTSGGGTSIIFQYWSIKTGKSVGFYQIIFHGAIILAAGLIFGLNIAIYTIVSQLISSIVLDKVFTGYNFMKLEVITTCGIELADELKTRLPHGVTMLDAIGAYTHQEKTVIFAVISTHEIQKYLAIIKEIDPNAFVVMTGVSKVKGKFTKKIIN